MDFALHFYSYFTRFHELQNWKCQWGRKYCESTTFVVKECGNVGKSNVVTMW